MTEVIDLWYEKSEDNRITTIGTSVMGGCGAFVVGLMLEKDDAEKRARYERKLAERFPQVEIIDVVDGPTPGVVTYRLRKKQSS